MKQIEISEKTFVELTKLARPLVDDADAVVSNMIRFYRKHHGISSQYGAKPPACIKRTTNADRLKRYVVDDYKNLDYVRSVVKIFHKNGQPLLNIQAIINCMFKFPNDLKMVDRKERAEKSVMATIRANPDIFSEPELKVFEVIK